MRLRESQRGMTAIGWVLVAMVGGVIALGLIKLFPVYLESYTVTSIMRSVTSDASITSPEQIRRGLSRRMQVNEVRDIALSDFNIERVDGRQMLTISYERRVPYLANIDFVLSFDKQQPLRGE